MCHPRRWLRHITERAYDVGGKPARCFDVGNQFA